MKQKPHVKAKNQNKPQHTKTGKASADIFSVPTSQSPTKKEIHIPIVKETVAEAVPQPESSESEKKPRGRPQEHTEERTKVTIILFDRQIAALDQLSLTIRAQTKTSISRAEIVRALVDATLESAINLGGIKSEAELKQLILTHLKR